MQVADVGLLPVFTEAFGEDVPFVDRIPADVVEQYREAHDRPIGLWVLFQQPLGIVERDRNMNVVLAHPQIGSGCAPDAVQSHACSSSGDSPGPFSSVTSPEEPFTRMRWPVLMRLVADPVPVTAGKPYSRQTIAACDIMPPISVTVARILPKTGPQLGAMTVATRMSPSWSRSRSSVVFTTRATPSTVPGEAGMPLNTPDF